MGWRRETVPEGILQIAKIKAVGKPSREGLAYPAQPRLIVNERGVGCRLLGADG